LVTWIKRRKILAQPAGYCGKSAIISPPLLHRETHCLRAAASLTPHPPLDHCLLACLTCHTEDGSELALGLCNANRLPRSGLGAIPEIDWLDPCEYGTAGDLPSGGWRVPPGTGHVVFGVEQIGGHGTSSITRNGVTYTEPPRPQPGLRTRRHLPLLRRPASPPRR
jgi:hypothetical protein